MQKSKVCAFFFITLISISSVSGIGKALTIILSKALADKLIIAAVISALAPVATPLGKRSAQAEEYLAADVNDCGKYLVCKLSEDEINVNRAEKEILNHFHADMNKIVLNTNSPRSAFQVAAYLGGIGENKVCERVYKKCKTSLRQLRKYVKFYSEE